MPRVENLSHQEFTIKNVVGSSCEHTKRSSIVYWERATGKKRSACSIRGCGRDAIHGSHVKLGYMNKNSYYWWIIPTCQRCNKSNSNTRYDVKTSTLAVREERIDVVDHMDSIYKNYMKTIGKPIQKAFKQLKLNL